MTRSVLIVVFDGVQSLDVRVDPEPIYVRDGPVWTSAGVTAGIDLALAVVEEDLGRDAALPIARHLVMFLRRPGGSPDTAPAELVGLLRSRAAAA